MLFSNKGNKVFELELQKDITRTLGETWWDSKCEVIPTSYELTQAGPAFMGPQAEFYLGAPQCHQYDWLLSSLIIHTL